MIEQALQPHEVKKSRTLVESRPFDYDPATGIRTTWHFFDDDTFTIEKTQDAEHILEHNLLLRNATPETWEGEGHGVRVAQLPLVVWQDLKNRGIIDDDKKFRAWLNDRDNRYFRTRDGRV